MLGRKGSVVSMEKYLGCSGFYYEEWKGGFYPQGLAKGKWLEYYARHFNTLELNSTFYHLPRPQTVLRWKDITPEGFTFALKGNRYITHTKKLKEVNEAVKSLYELIYPLEEKLGAVLWQLQDTFARDDERLEAFCKTLSREFANVIEFRHPSWFVPQVFQLLKEYGVLCCSLSSPLNIAEELYVNRGNAYLRFHGKKEWYHDLYSIPELSQWVEKINERQPDRLFVFFNNTFHMHAVENCRQMEQMLRQQAA